MAKVLYLVSFLSLLGAGLLLGLCGWQWRQGVPLDEHEAWVPVTEQLRTNRNADGSSQTASSPLVKQAEALALYLNPPVAAPTVRSAATQPAVRPASAPRPPSPTPQFRILAISYYRSHPEKSLAMVWDASKGGYWIRKGDRLGHFVVERIEKEAVVYRDGQQLRQMAVAVKQPPQLARLKSKEAASLQEAKAQETLVSASP